jgi:hypothetical protein
MAKKYLFADLNVNASALYQTNPQEFFKKALLDSGSFNYFRTFVNVKDKVAVASLEFGNVLSAENCNFTGVGAALSAKTISVCGLSVNTEFCQYTLESSFISEWMRAGSNANDFGPAQFMDVYYERLAASVANQLEVLTWRGDIATTGQTSLCDGLEKKLKLANAPGVIVTPTPVSAITSANVVAELTKAVALLPDAIKFRQAELVMYVAPNVAQAYQIALATSTGNPALFALTDANPLMFLGIKMIVAQGMTQSRFVISLMDNFIYATDLVGDYAEIVTINMKETTGDRLIRTITDLKWSVDFVNAPEIVTYNLG